MDDTETELNMRPSYNQHSPTQSISGQNSPQHNPAPETNNEHDTITQQNTTENAPRRSIRNKQQPHWMKDFTNCLIETNNGKGYTPPTHPFSTNCHDPQYINFLNSIDQVITPSTYKQASKYPEWVDAMNSELEALLKNKTWTLTSLPKGKKPIGCRWTYKTKLNADGSIDKNKARLVAKGYNQINGIDFHQKFAPVAKNVTIRILLALTAAKQWHLHQIDVNNAFLHGHINEDIYMTVPQGLKDTTQGQVCKLHKSLYGLKQSSRQWHLEISNTLIQHKFKKSEHDHCFFIKQEGNDTTCLLIYVDDILISGNSLTTIEETKQLINNKYPIKDLGTAKYFLGLEIARTRQGIYINQRKYTLDILANLGIMGSKPRTNPINKSLKLTARPPNDTPCDQEQYRHLIGRLLYLNLTRPDITYSVQQLSQFVNQPYESHWKAALHIAKYLKGTPSLGLFYPSTNSMNIEAYSDSDWGSCIDSRKSITGYCIYIGNALVAWKTKKQNTVSRSTAEAEYRSMATTVCELQWISYLLNDFKLQVKLPITLNCDNQAAIHITENPVFHERTKHLDIDCHVVRNKYKEGFISLKHVSSDSQKADIFTKALEGQKFQDCRLYLQLRDFHLEGGI